MNKMKIIKKILLGLFIVLGLVLTFGSAESFKSNLFKLTEEKGQSITIAYTNWDTEVASTNVIVEVLRQAGYDVTMTPVEVAPMFEAVASGQADATVAAWLPSTHASYYERYGGQVDDLGSNLDGAASGLAVPVYMEDVNSIEDLTDEDGKSITGIEPGAGLMAATERALKDYPNLSDWTVQASSSGAMTTELGTAYAEQEEIIVTAWSPHWKFQEYDLKYLEDPRGSFGEAESIHTFTRKGLDEDMPKAYQILDNFYWEVEDMEAVMVEIYGGTEPKVAAQNWIDANSDTVDEWLVVE